MFEERNKILTQDLRKGGEKKRYKEMGMIDHISIYLG